MIFARGRKAFHIIAVTAALLGALSSAQAAQCRGTKIIQSCTTSGGFPNIGACGAYANDIGGIQYQSCVASAPLVGGVQTCQPIRVPCDYPENIFDLFSKILGPE